MPQIGGYIPGFAFTLNAQTMTPRTVTSVSSSTVSTQVLDAQRQVITTVGGTYGSQWQITVVPQQNVIGSLQPPVSLSVSDASKATIVPSGSVSYVADGSFNVIGISQATNFDPARTQSITLTNATNGGATTVNTVYVPDTTVASTHVLVVYNTTSTNSSTIKDYYLAHRPGFSGANVLGISTSSAERVTLSYFQSNIRDPILSWMSSNPTKLIRYVILMPDIPSQTSTPNTDWTGNPSVQWLLYSAMSTLGTRTGDEYNYTLNSNTRFSLARYPGVTTLVTAINFGTNADCQAYIDKLATVYSAMSTPALEISGNNAGRTAAGGYYLDEYQASYGAYFGANETAAIQAENSSIGVTLAGSTHLTNLANVRGYLCWGGNGGMGGDYANNGSVVFTGSSGWYVIKTVESFNGQRVSNQGNFIDWFSSNAFGGTSYSNTPAGAVSHVDEPYLSGINDKTYFAMWERGWNLAECAWYSRKTPKLQVLGDPLVKR